MKKITMLASLMLVFVCIVSQNIPVGLASIEDDPGIVGLVSNEDDPAIVVNVLLVCDDAFDAYFYHMGLLRWVLAKTLVYDGAMPAMNEIFYKEFGVKFYWDFGWQDWDSSDVSGDAYAAEWLEDAISDTGFDKGIVIDGKRIDILMAWTGRWMYPIGYAPSPLNACVIMAPINWMKMDNTAQHELSHLFNREGHCNNECVMNEDPNEALTYNVWCETCFQIINSNKFKFNVVGDVDGNHVVDVFDVAQVSYRWESQKGDDDWAPSCDINGDYLIYTEDADIICMHYGETAPAGEYILSISAGVGGTTDPTPKRYFYEPETIVTVTAAPIPSYGFDYWVLDGTIHHENPITVTMNSDHTLKAHFRDTFTLTISASSGGNTNPAPGTYPCDYGSSVTVRAIACEGYYFDYWRFDGVQVYDYKFTVTMDSDHGLRAYFWPEHQQGAGGCPTLFVWDGSEYVEEALLDIHAEWDVTLQHTIEETLVPDKNSYKLSLRELDNFTSHIDQVKLYVVDSDGAMYETHLTNAAHSELGDVKDVLLHDDDTRVDLTPEQTIDLKFTVPNIDDVAYFTFEINGFNKKWVGDGP